MYVSIQHIYTPPTLWANVHVYMYIYTHVHVYVLHHLPVHICELSKSDTCIHMYMYIPHNNSVHLHVHIRG